MKLVNCITGAFCDQCGDYIKPMAPAYLDKDRKSWCLKCAEDLE